MNAELNNNTSIEAKDVRILTPSHALAMKVRDKISPDSRLFITDDGQEIQIKQVRGGLNVFMPKTQLQMHFVANDEIADSKKSGVLSMLDDCTEIRVDESKSE